MEDQMINAPAKEITCEECRDLLSEYVDSEISDSQRASVEYHIKTCTKCSTESTRINGLKRIARHWDGVQGSGAFRKAVVEKMIRESQQMPSGPIREAAAASARQTQAENPEAKSLPPVWLLLGACAVAAIGYFIVSALR